MLLCNCQMQSSLVLFMISLMDIFLGHERAMRIFLPDHEFEINWEVHPPPTLEIYICRCIVIKIHLSVKFSLCRSLPIGWTNLLVKMSSYKMLKRICNCINKICSGESPEEKEVRLDWWVTVLGFLHHLKWQTSANFQYGKFFFFHKFF